MDGGQLEKNILQEAVGSLSTSRFQTWVRLVKSNMSFKYCKGERRRLEDPVHSGAGQKRDTAKAGIEVDGKMRAINEQRPSLGSILRESEWVTVSDSGVSEHDQIGDMSSGFGEI